MKFNFVNVIFDYKKVDCVFNWVSRTFIGKIYAEYVKNIHLFLFYFVAVGLYMAIFLFKTIFKLLKKYRIKTLIKTLFAIYLVYYFTTNFFKADLRLLYSII